MILNNSTPGRVKKTFSKPEKAAGESGKSAAPFRKKCCMKSDRVPHGSEKSTPPTHVPPTGYAQRERQESSLPTCRNTRLSLYAHRIQETARQRRMRKTSSSACPGARLSLYLHQIYDSFLQEKYGNRLDSHL